MTRSAIGRARSSLPPRGRGSKPMRAGGPVVDPAGRSPRGGVDRNISLTASKLVTSPSLPPRGRGSKRRRSRSGCARGCVAPPAGAWIETWLWRQCQVFQRRRSPRGGVDRNPPRLGTACHWPRSLPPRGRGSKQLTRQRPMRWTWSLPPRGRGSKLHRGSGHGLGRSRSPRGGVDRNSFQWGRAPGQPMSLTPRGRGSKLCRFPETLGPSHVAPPAGAWIETMRRGPMADGPARRSPRGGVDRNCVRAMNSSSAIERRSPRGGVDRNTNAEAKAAAAAAVAPPAGAWIETKSRRQTRQPARRRSPRGGVDRNPAASRRRSSGAAASLPPRGRGSKHPEPVGGEHRYRVAPPAGAWIETSMIKSAIGRARSSLPPRGRGSKRCPASHAAASHRHVAPPAGAWIETRHLSPARCLTNSRSPRGGVDRNSMGG